MDRGLAALGRELAAVQDEFIGQSRELERGRTRLLVAVAEHPPSARLYRIWSVAALLFTAAVIGFWLRGAMSQDRLGLVAGSGAIGEWIAATGNVAVPIGFSDGTKFELQPSGRARVTALAPTGATVVVERGELRASVRPGRGNHWRIDVGPFRVTVLGTVFDVSWQPEVERFSLKLRKGVVAVKGPVIGAERIVRAGEQLDVWVGQGELKSTRLNENNGVGVSRGVGADRAGQPAHLPQVVDQASIGASSQGGGGVAMGLAHREKRSDEALSIPYDMRNASDVANGQARDPKASFPTSWGSDTSRSASTREHVHQREPKPHASVRATSVKLADPAAELASFNSMARANRYRDALEEAERIGIDSICNAGASVDLMLLGDVARLAGNIAVAQRAYLSVRRRFVGIPAAQSAFMLGRIAHDQRGAFTESAEYFATYLREAPGGAFAVEAASRLVESRMHAGDRDGAKAAAAQYLVWYPSGPYAAKARELIAEP